MKNNFGIWTSVGRMNLTEEMRDEYHEEYKERYGQYPSTQEEFDMFIHEEVDRDLTDELTNIHYYEKAHGAKRYVIYGTVHRWTGDHEAVKIVRSMEEVIKVCLAGQEDAKVYFKNGQLRIDTYNHDSDCSGNFLRVREVTDMGENYYSCCCDNEFKLLKRMFHDSHYTHRVTIFNEIYGC